MNVPAIRAIVAKDFRAFTRDRFYVLITLLGLVFYVVIFWLLPDTVDETIEMGVAQIGMDAYFENLAGDGLDMVQFDSTAALEEAIKNGDGPAVGLAFPPDFVSAVAGGNATEVTLFVTSEVPEEVQGGLSSMVREMAYLAAGNAPLVTFPEEIVVGVDRAGDQVSLQETMRPLFVFFMLMVEMMALATLVAEEIQSRTVTAILTTPASVSDFLTAKVLFGTSLALIQAVILMAAIGSLGSNTLVLLVTLTLGALLVTGFGLWAGSAGKDFLSIIGWSMLFLIPLAVPSIAVLFPGTAAAWVRALPSWGLVEAIVGATAYGDGFGDLAVPLLTLAGWCIVAMLAGYWVLRRRVVRL